MHDVQKTTEKYKYIVFHCYSEYSLHAAVSLQLLIISCAAFAFEYWCFLRLGNYTARGDAERPQRAFTSAPSSSIVQ